MSNRRMLSGILAIVAGWAAVATIAGGRTLAQVGEEKARVFLPLVWLSVDRESLPTVAAAPPSTLRPTAVDPTATPSPTATESAPTAPATVAPSATPTASTIPPTDVPTDPPTDVPTPTPKTPAATGRIRGRLTDKGKPMAEGFGEPGFPQIELERKGSSGLWVKVANAVTDAAGAFAFVNPPALEPGEAYRVRWNNPIEDGADLWLHRWWSRDIVSFGDGKDVDAGVFELENFKLTAPCHDCLQTGAISFEWQGRDHASEIYRWSVFDGCGDVENRAKAWRTPSLGRATRYVTSPPPGFNHDARYCWYVFIEDGRNGTGWTFYDHRVTWCSSPETCRGQRALQDWLRPGW